MNRRTDLRRLTILKNYPSNKIQNRVKVDILSNANLNIYNVFYYYCFCILFLSTRPEKCENNYLSFQDIFTYFLFKFQIRCHNETRFRLTMVRQHVEICTEDENCTHFSNPFFLSVIKTIYRPTISVELSPP